MKTMRVGPSRSSRTLSREPAPAVPFNAFIAYDAVPAAREAMSTVNEVLRAAPHSPVLHPMLWRFNQLDQPRWQATSLAEAARADVVVLASGSRSPLSPEIEAWVGQLLTRKQGQRITVVVLLGRNDAWTISLDVPHAQRRTPAAEIAAMPVQQTLQPMLASRAA